MLFLCLAGSNVEPQKNLQTVLLAAPLLCKEELGISSVAEQVADLPLAK